jgi:hypothetical protein
MFFASFLTFPWQRSSTKELVPGRFQDVSRHVRSLWKPWSQLPLQASFARISARMAERPSAPRASRLGRFRASRFLSCGSRRAGARRIAKGIARLPEFLSQHPGFYSRGGGDHGGARLTRTASHRLTCTFARVGTVSTRLCKLNDIPFDQPYAATHLAGKRCRLTRRDIEQHVAALIDLLDHLDGDSDFGPDFGSGDDREARTQTGNRIPTVPRLFQRRPRPGALRAGRFWLSRERRRWPRDGRRTRWNGAARGFRTVTRLGVTRQAGVRRSGSP